MEKCAIRRIWTPLKKSRAAMPSNLISLSPHFDQLAQGNEMFFWGKWEFQGLPIDWEVIATVLP
jgi:hypothetical protein